MFHPALTFILVFGCSPFYPRNNSKINTHPNKVLELSIFIFQWYWVLPLFHHGEKQSCETWWGMDRWEMETGICIFNQGFSLFPQVIILLGMKMSTLLQILPGYGDLTYNLLVFLFFFKNSVLLTLLPSIEFVFRIHCVHGNTYISDSSWGYKWETLCQYSIYCLKKTVRY